MRQARRFRGDSFTYQAGHPYPRGVGRGGLVPSPEVQAMSAIEGARFAAPAALAGAGIVLVAVWTLFMVLAVLAVTTVVSWPSPAPAQVCAQYESDSESGAAATAVAVRANPRAGGITQPCR